MNTNFKRKGKTMNKIGNVGNQVSFNGIFKNSKKELDFYQKAHKAYSDELKTQGLDCLARAKQVLVKPHTSAPKTEYIIDTVYNEQLRLEKNFNKIDAEEFKEKTITNPKSGIVYSKEQNSPWSGVVQTDKYTLTEYKQGKPVTVVKTEDTDNKTNIRLIKYDYGYSRDLSRNVIKTETSVFKDYNDEGHKLVVPKQIQDEVNS